MRFRSYYLIAVLLLAVGCDKSSAVKMPELHVVQGTLTKDGKAVKGGVVQFTPDKLSEYLVTSEVNASGKFELYTLGNNKREKGAPEGNYTVMYTMSGTEQSIAPPIITTKMYTIEAGKTNDFTIELLDN